MGGNRQVKIEDLNLVNAWKEFSIFVGLFWFCNPAYADTRVNWWSDHKYLNLYSILWCVTFTSEFTSCVGVISLIVMRPEYCEYSASLRWVFEPQWASAADLNFEPRQLLNATRPKTTATLGIYNVKESDAARLCIHNSPMGKCVRACVRERASKYVIAGPVTSMCDADLWWLWACVAAYWCGVVLWRYGDGHLSRNEF